MPNWWRNAWFVRRIRPSGRATSTPSVMPARIALRSAFSSLSSRMRASSCDDIWFNAVASSPSSPLTRYGGLLREIAAGHSPAAFCICRRGRVTRLDSQYKIGMAARPTSQAGHTHGMEHPRGGLLNFHQRHGHAHDSHHLVVANRHGHIKQIDANGIALDGWRCQCLREGPVELRADRRWFSMDLQIVFRLVGFANDGSIAGDHGDAQAGLFREIVAEMVDVRRGW